MGRVQGGENAFGNFIPVMSRGCEDVEDDGCEKAHHLEKEKEGGGHHHPMPYFGIGSCGGRHLASTKPKKQSVFMFHKKQVLTSIKMSL